MTETGITHIYYHLILRRCSLTDYSQREKQHTDLGAHFVASFFERSDSETPTDHFHCLIRLPACKKTYEDRYRRTYEERNLQVIKQIQPITLDPTHLENTLLYIAKDGHQVKDDGTIVWADYIKKRKPTAKETKIKLNKTEALCRAFANEIVEHPELYRRPVLKSKFSCDSYTYERNVIKFVSKFYSQLPQGFDEIIILRAYHLLVARHDLTDCVNIVDLCIQRLLK